MYFGKKNFFWTLLSKLLTISGRLYCAHWTEVLLVGVVLFLQIELCLCIMKQIQRCGMVSRLRCASV